MIRARYHAVGTRLLAVLALVLVARAQLFAQANSGDVRGVTRNAEGQPLPEVQIAVCRVASIDGQKCESGPAVVATSGTDGAFIVQNLNPGHYRVIAKKTGFAPSQPTNLEIAGGKSLHSDFLLAALQPPDVPARGVSTDTASSSTQEASPEEALPPAVAKELAAMKERIEQLEIELQGRKDVQPPSPKAEGVSTSSSDAPASLQTRPNASLPNQSLASLTGPSAPATPEAIGIPAQGQTLASAQQQAVSSTPTAPAVDTETPFAYADYTWLNGNPRNKDTVWDSKYFTPEFRSDVNFMLDYNHPIDHTMGGSTESFRSGEWQLEQMSFGGNLHVGQVQARVLTMAGLFATTTPRNDGSAGVGQWDLNDAYRYFSEANAGYHFNVAHGLNVDAGIFVSYIGLFSYYNFDNWTYQPSYVSSNTPWFFNGLRIQYFPTNKLKIEPWIINGWQSYARFNKFPGLGGQILWRPKEWLSLVFNNYGMGTDTLGVPGRSRIHTDDSIEVRYYNQPDNKGLDKIAMSFTGDLGCEYGGGVSCHRNTAGGPKQDFAGWMLYNRFWFDHDRYGLTLGGGVLDNPGRYLTLLPPINAANAVTGSPYFPAAPGSIYKAWDSTVTFDYMPQEYITFRLEQGYRYSNVPYWSGPGGITPPTGNNGAPAEFVCNDGTPSASSTGCGGDGGLWSPDLRKHQWVSTFAIMVKF